MEQEIIDFKVGETYRVVLNGMSSYESRKIHIIYVLDGAYEGEKLIVFRFYGKRKQWWHQQMETAENLSWSIEKFNKYN